MALTPKQAERLLAKRKASQISPEKLLEDCFPQQLSFIQDPTKLKTLFCTRRAAKSYTAALYMIYEALLYPNSNILFLGLTRSSAKSIVWKDCLKVLDKRHRLKARFNLTELTMTLPNGSVIAVTGADAEEEEMNKLLGRKYRLVCIDEASMYTINMHNLVYGILKPATADVRGTICMMGTSSNFTRGLFYDVTTGKEAGWKVFEWSAYDNPHVSKQWEEEIEEIDRLRPLFKETPLYKQWYLNKWVVDTDKLVYKFNEEKNLCKELPKNLNIEGWVYILGVDTGWEDDNAFVLCGFHTSDPNLYVVDTYNKKHMTFDKVVEKIQEYMRDTSKPISKVIIDGANKQGVETMRHRSQIPFEYADKIGKVDFIEMLNADLIQAKIKIHVHNRTLIDELMGLVWKTDGDKIIVPKKEHPSLPNHLCDAFLYAWRNGYHYAYQPSNKGPRYGTPEWANEEQERMRVTLYESIKAEQTQLHDGWDELENPFDNGLDLNRWKK